MPLRIFLSHSSTDREWVQRLPTDIGNEAVDFYAYENDVQPGRILAEKLQEAIARCDILIVFITRHSHTSTYMHQEIGVALGLHKVIVPLVEKGIPKRSLSMLDGCEFIRFDPQRPEVWIGALSAFLTKYILESQPPTPTPHEQDNVTAREHRLGDAVPILFGGMSRDEVFTLVLSLAVVVIGIYFIYTIGRSSGGGGAST